MPYQLRLETRDQSREKRRAPMNDVRSTAQMMARIAQYPHVLAPQPIELRVKPATMYRMSRMIVVGFTCVSA